MIMCEIHSLLERSFSDGFTIEGLSKATNISVELIDRCYHGENLVEEDLHTLTYLLVFLTQLYCCDTADSSYLQNIVTVICDYFMIPLSTIAKYMNLSAEQLSVFLDNPEHDTNAYNLSLKLMHLFTTLVRDKRHSV
jgi:hypothetical protein